MKPLKLNIQFFADDHSIGVDFRVNISEAQKELKKLEKEVKANESIWKRFAVETENWDKNADGLQGGIEKLTDKQKAQTKVVENLKKQYELVKDRLGENDQWTANLNERYEKARLELAKTNEELKDYQKKLDNARDETKELDDASNTLNDRFTTLKSTVSQLIADGIKKLATEAVDAVKKIGEVGISFESAFAGVRKTVDATEEEFAQLKNDILDMSTEVASSADDIASVMEMAGQLGISNDALTDFTKTMIMLGDSTNMGAGEAAETLARFANITGMSQSDFEKLGSTLVDLGKKCCPAY